MVPHFHELSVGVRVVEKVRRASQRLTRVANERMATGGASYARARILACLEHGPMRPSELAQRFGQAPRTITEAIDGLQRDGLVIRETDAADRRVRPVAITEAGRAALHYCYDVAIVLGNEIEALLGGADLSRFESVLDRIEQFSGDDAPVREAGR